MSACTDGDTGENSTHGSPVDGAVDGARHERRETKTSDREHEWMGQELISKLVRREGGELSGHG